MTWNAFFFQGLDSGLIHPGLIRKLLRQHSHDRHGQMCMEAQQAGHPDVMKTQAADFTHGRKSICAVIQMTLTPISMIRMSTGFTGKQQ